MSVLSETDEDQDFLKATHCLMDIDALPVGPVSNKIFRQSISVVLLYTILDRTTSSLGNLVEFFASLIIISGVVPSSGSPRADGPSTW